MDVRQGLPEGEEWIDDWLSSISAHTAQTRQLSARLAHVSASASSSDGAVEVTVSSTGTVTDLRLEESVRAWPAQQLAAEVLTVMREAQSKLAARVAQAAAQGGGEQSPTVRAMVEDLAQRYPRQSGTGWDVTNRGGYGSR